MNRFVLSLFVLCCFTAGTPFPAAAELPPPANHQVSFAKDIAPLFQNSCVKCHGKGKEKGGFSLETREAFLKGGDSGPAAEAGKSAESYIVELVASEDSSEVMPKKGSKWNPEQIGLLRAWIDQGMQWDEGVTFAKSEPLNLHPRSVELPQSIAEEHPVDRLLAVYFQQKGVQVPEVVPDAQFARRAYLDIIGLLPTPEQLDSFRADSSLDKRRKLVRSLLANSRGYADHWLTFWNDLLRNDYKGTGFIDGGRRQISGWLYNALLNNIPYDRFVRELVNPSGETEGFTAGILWRGNVNASMTPPMQAAQNISQVFFGVNLKCASCHDSFINDWSLADAYGLAAVYSDGPLELVECDKPTGKQAAMRFLYPELGDIDAAAQKNARLRQFAELMTGPKNGRLPRTIVNRLWERLLGRGLVEPVDDMEQPAWNVDLLDWLAEDLVAHNYDLKRTIEMIVTSRAYQLPVAAPPKEKEEYVFRGPLSRRMTAEQFSDAVSSLLGDWAALPDTLEFDLSGGGAFGDFKMPEWIWTTEPISLPGQRNAARTAKARAEDAQKKASRALELLERSAPEAAEAAKQAAAAAEESLRAAKAVETAAQSNTRHRVIFRKRVELAEQPSRAYATLAVSQGFDLLVNGQTVRPVRVDNHRNGRIRLFNLQPFLRAGENVIAVSVDSHTDKGMNDTERKQFPKSLNHVNTRSGLAFYARCTVGEEQKEIISDQTWHVRRAPGGDWASAKFADNDWGTASLLPDGVAPVDEGPGLPPVRRKDFAQQPVDLGPPLRAAVSTAAQTGNMRAAFLGADPLALALDRPNREQVTTTRLSAPTTMQALELTNGSTLDERLRTVSVRLAEEVAKNPGGWADRLFRHAVARPPTSAENALMQELFAGSVRPESVADALWAVTMLPEFQLIN